MKVNKSIIIIQREFFNLSFFALFIIPIIEKIIETIGRIIAEIK